MSSRQLRWQEARKRHAQCPQCGLPSLPPFVNCASCHGRFTQQNRKRGHLPYNGALHRGRPAYWSDVQLELLRAWQQRWRQREALIYMTLRRRVARVVRAALGDALRPTQLIRFTQDVTRSRYP